MNVQATMVAAITTASTLLEVFTVDVILDLNLKAATRKNVEVGFFIRIYIFFIIIIVIIIAIVILLVVVRSLWNKL